MNGQLQPHAKERGAVRAGGLLKYKPMNIGKFFVSTTTNSPKISIIGRIHAFLIDLDSSDVSRIKAEFIKLAYAIYKPNVDKIRIVEIIGKQIIDVIKSKSVEMKGGFSWNQNQF